MKKQFKSESKRLLDLMINSIYTNKDISIREIISNASDALDKLYYQSLTDKNIKIDKEYTINAIKTNEYTDKIRNKLLNQIAIRQNTNVDFNDIKDALIATNYLEFIKQCDEEVYFVTFDYKFIKKLKTCNDINYQNSIKFIDSLFDKIETKL